VTYSQGQYDEADGFRSLLVKIQEHEKASNAKTFGRLFYLALPPSVYLTVLNNIRNHASDFAPAKSDCGCGSETWLRVIIEKPFGRDLESSEDLSEKVSKLFSEQQVYRIDHFLGKELTQAGSHPRVCHAWSDLTNAAPTFAQGHIPLLDVQVQHSTHRGTCASALLSSE
jgi:glucose-6-phosphate 1-dehydrogenase